MDIVPHAERLLLPELAKPKRRRIIICPQCGRCRRISQGVWNLLKKIRGYPSWKLQGFVYAHQDTLADELGCSIRSIFNWTKDLLDLGLIVTEQHGKSLRYYPGREDGVRLGLGPGQEQIDRRKLCRCPLPPATIDEHRQTLPARFSGDYRQTLPMNTGNFSGDAFTDLEKEIREEELSSSSNRLAAAAEEVKPAEGATTQRQPIQGTLVPAAEPSAMQPAERAELIACLIERGMPRSIAESNVGQAADPALIREILAFHQRQKERGNLKNPPGALRSMLTDPARWGIESTEAGWESPTDTLTTHTRTGGNLPHGRKLRRHPNP